MILSLVCAALLLLCAAGLVVSGIHRLNALFGSKECRQANIEASTQMLALAGICGAMALAGMAAGG